MKLLPLSDLIQTSRIDHGNWNYKTWLGYICKKRFALISKLLPVKSLRLLEIGYGSGVFMPELTNYANELYGIDIHDKNVEVETILKKNHVSARLIQGDVAKISFPSAYFDTIVSVSALEFVDDLPSAVQEIARVLKPDGVFVIVMPGSSKILDLGLFIATGESAKKDFKDKRPGVLPELNKIFNKDKQLHFPPLVPVYTAYRFTHKVI